MLCYSATHAVTFALSAGNAHDALPSQELLTRSGQEPMKEIKRDNWLWI